MFIFFFRTMNKLNNNNKAEKVPSASGYPTQSSSRREEMTPAQGPSREHTAPSASWPEHSLFAGQREVSSYQAPRGNHHPGLSRSQRRRARKREKPRPAASERQSAPVNAGKLTGSSAVRKERASTSTGDSTPGPSTSAAHRRSDLKLPARGQPGGLDDPLRKGLSGAKCRWYIRFLGEGKPPEEARQLALEVKTPHTVPRAVKRGSSMITPPQQEPPKKLKQGTPLASREASRPGCSYAAALSLTKVAVLPVEYPSVTLSSEQQSELEQALVEAMLHATKAFEGKLAFDGIKFRHGMIILNCGNPEAVSWLQEQAPKLRHWEGPALKTLVGNDIPEGSAISIFFPRSSGVPPSVLLRLLQVQNNVTATEWKVISTANVDKTQGQLLRLGIDELSAKTIRDKEHRLSFRFGAVNVHGLKKTSEVGMEQEKEAPPVPEEGTAVPDAVEGLDLTSLIVESAGEEPMTEEEEMVLLQEARAGPDLPVEEQ